MPKQKTAASAGEKKQISIPIIFGIIILILFLILITIFILFPSIFWNKTEKEEVKVETEDVTIEIEPSFRDTLSEKDIEKDIELEMIEITLYTYYAEHERFPDGLDGLRPDFMDEIPKVPGTEDEYMYTVGDDNQSFKLSVALGEGGEELMKNDGGDDDNLYEVSGPKLELEP